MITASELRIGNYVEVENYKIIKVENIHQKGTTIKDEQYLICMLKPIPLTEDILFNCGYIKQERNKYRVMGHVIWNVQEDMFVCDKNGVIIKYLHQLQNLYLSITGTELTVKL